MPKVSIYVPKELHARAKALQLPLTKVCQAAIAEAVGERSVNLAELMDRQLHNMERMIELYRARVTEGYETLLAAGIDPAVLFAGMTIAGEFVDAAKARQAAAGARPQSALTVSHAG